VRARLEQAKVVVNGKLGADVELSTRATCTVEEWSCGYSENWASSDPAIAIAANPCDKNVLMVHELTASRRIRRHLVLVAGKPVGHHRFRIAFHSGQSKKSVPAEVSSELQLEIQLR
jgi:hypothetical protein